MAESPPHISNTASHKAPPALLSYQQRWVADASPLKAIEKSRRTGITWTEASDNALTAAFPTPADRTNVYYVAYNQDMTAEYIRTCVMWARAFNYVASEVEEEFWEKDDDDKHIRTYTIKFPDSDFCIVAFSSRPSNLRGHRGITVTDEVVPHEQLDELLKAALAMLIWGGKVRITSTHDGDDNPFNMLIGDIRAGRQGGSVHRTTLRETVSEGSFRRACPRAGKEWSEVSEQVWMVPVYKFYGAGASEESDCIPVNGGGAWLSRALAEPRMPADTPVLRLTCREGYELLSDEVRFRGTQDWLDEHLKPLLEALPAGARPFLGRGFDRSGDLPVDYPSLQEKNLTRRVPFVLELRSVPFRQQEQITQYLMDGLPGLLGAAFDVRGNGAYLAKYTVQRYGSGRVQQVMPAKGWYREHMPPVKVALEDGNLANLPKDEDTLDDLWVVQVVNSVLRVSEQHSKVRADGGKRHGDLAIVLALVYFASCGINKGPVKASSHRRRQAVRILEGF